MVKGGKSKKGKGRRGKDGDEDYGYARHDQRLTRPQDQERLTEAVCTHLIRT
jgi:hypothetical protein